MMVFDTKRGYYLGLFLTPLFLGLFFPASKAQLTIRVTSWPSQPATPEIYLAGNFNGWNPGLSGYQLKLDSGGVYTITIQPSPANLEFKFTRGSWSTVEKNAAGQDIANRKFTYNGSPATLNLSIAGWGGGSQTSTASANVVLLDDDLPIKSLQRSRKIWLYLPPDYHSKPDKIYPVIYMLDGQNVFDNATSFSGEWRVDETLDSLFQKGDGGCIVVAIANGEAQRINEYSPWIHAQYGGGDGEKFLLFLTEELKPYIDQHYRTRPESDQTAIMGSSMAGLFSFYAGFERPDVFGRQAPMSTSFWFAPAAFNWIKDKVPANKDIKVYLTVGTKEGGSQLMDMQKMYNLLLQEGFDSEKIKADSDTNEGHNEQYWSKKFPVVYQWLMAQNFVFTSENPKPEKRYIHCQDSTCFYEGVACDDCEVEILDLSGKLIVRKKMDQNLSWIIPDLKLAIFKVVSRKGVIHTEKYIADK
ncbi:MAG: alpha/beta hydrolase [Saprospiraceae bacterium]|nr:alpha/beta hydrolase [Saprospiraceae bacterium]